MSHNINWVKLNVQKDVYDVNKILFKINAKF